MRSAQAAEPFHPYGWLGRSASHACAWLAILGISFCFGIVPCKAQQPNTKNVLVLYSGLTRDHESLDLVEAVIRQKVQEQVNFSVAYLDYERLDNEEYKESLAETFRHGYGKLDLIIPFAYQALEFAVQYRDDIGPGVPIAFGFVAARRLEGQKLWPGVTGITIPVGIQETIDLALRLHPDAKAVAVISGTQDYWWSVAHKELLRHQDRVREIDLVGPPSGEMMEKVAALPAHTVVLFQLAAQDSSHPEIGVYDVLAATAQRLPTYSAWKELCFDHGGIGGAFPDTPKEAWLTAEIAARVLNGERPEDIPIVADTNLQVLVDWRELRRWKIPESALPTDRVILNRQPTVWERYKDWAIGAILLLVGQAILIVALLWQGARKRKAEAVLRESEERFRVMANTMPAVIWMCDSKGKAVYLNERWHEFGGPEPKAGYGDSWAEYIHPDDLDHLRDILSHALKTHEGYSNEYRLRRNDGTYRWMFNVASPRVNGDGSFAGFIGSSIDTTDQKTTHQALEKISGQLIEAQENERSRIARELHDDICQRLALLSMELDQANYNLKETPEFIDLEEIQKHCVEIATDVQSLSHQLHSSTLDYLGIVSAVRGLCEEVSRQHKVNIAFRDKNVPKPLPKDISLCLFRVAQEALHNAVKYSGTDQFTVEIYGTPEEIRLTVTDRGKGFDLEQMMEKRGLGLVSMQERVHLVHGIFSIHSKPGEGTKVVAIVPLIRVSQETPLDEAASPQHSI